MLAAVWAGGVGNAIDRVVHGYVVDMFEVEFINFAVFNVADIFIVAAVSAYLPISCCLTAAGKKERPHDPALRNRGRPAGCSLSTQALEGMTRSAAQRLLEGNHVKKDGQPVKKNQKTEAGADYTVEIPEAQPIALQPEKIDLDIAYEDSDVVIINKPKGMVVHPAAGHWSGTLVNALLYHCGDSLSGINGQLRPGIVHRIDKDTSGLLLVAKNDFAHQKLAAQLADHTMHRTYVCLVCGNIRDDNGVIDAPIARHPQDRKKMAVCPDGQARRAHAFSGAGTVS